MLPERPARNARVADASWEIGDSLGGAAGDAIGANAPAALGAWAAGGSLDGSGAPTRAGGSAAAAIAAVAASVAPGSSVGTEAEHSRAAEAWWATPSVGEETGDVAKPVAATECPRESARAEGSAVVGSTAKGVESFAFDPRAIENPGVSTMTAQG